MARYDEPPVRPDDTPQVPAAIPPEPAPRGLTVEDVARRYRISPDKVRAWIASGELPAVNTAATLCGRPRWVIQPEALADFEKARRGGPPPAQRRKRRRAGEVDYFP